jgi:uncharacterized damage-inducible protein DinB
MPMQYEQTLIAETEVPRSAFRLGQHLLDTYASETNKVASVWARFDDSDLDWRPNERASSVRDILRHQLLSERRFFAEFLGLPEPAAAEVLPASERVADHRARLIELARPRLALLAAHEADWWLDEVPFFDVRRERIWVFWRRVLHTAHHRTQLTTYLRLLGRAVPPTYGPTGDVTWSGADPTTSVAAAERR